MWQIIRMQLMSSINLKNHPELVALLEDGEDLQDLLSLPPEDVLIRWVNYHMKAAGNARRLAKSNFGRELKDSEMYVRACAQPTSVPSAGNSNNPLLSHAFARAWVASSAGRYACR